MAGPNKKKRNQQSAGSKTDGAMQQKKKAIGWLYTATDKYYLTGPSSKITKSKIHIQYCLEKIMTSSPHVSNLETVVTYPFQKCSSRKQSPFMHACALGNVDLMEYYLSLFIMVRLTKRQINNRGYGATFRTWMIMVRHGPTIVKDFDLYLDQEYNEDIAKVMDGRKLSTENIFDIVLSFLVDHPKRESKINPLIKSFIHGPEMTRSTTGGGTKGPGRSKKLLPKINCRDNLELDLDDVYDHEDEYSCDEGYHYGDQSEMYENTEANGDSRVADTAHDSHTNNRETDDEDQIASDYKEEENEVDADELSSGWEDMFDLDSLSDGEISQDIISFNASFANDSDPSIENPIETIHSVGDDWDAIPEVQSVISVDTFSGEKLLFSYKDALFVNKEEQKAAPIGKLTMKVERQDMASASGADKVVDFEMRDESDLLNVYFDHNSAKLKGGQRRTLRELKGN